MNGLRGLIDAAGGLVSLAIIIAAGVAVLVFLWGLARFIFHAGDAKKTEEGRNIMVWGVIALFVMTSTWGLVRFLQKQLGINSGGTVRGINISEIDPGTKDGIKGEKIDGFKPLDAKDEFNLWREFNNKGYLQ